MERDRPREDEPATAVDVVLRSRLADGRRAAVLVEVKLSEDGFSICNGPDSCWNWRQDVCESAEVFFDDPNACYLRRPKRKRRDRRYWEIFTEKHGCVRDEFPGADANGPCSIAGNAQQPMRKLAIARALEQEGVVDEAWFVLCAHDGNPDVPRHWEVWRGLLPDPDMAPLLPASAVIDAVMRKDTAYGPNGSASATTSTTRMIEMDEPSYNRTPSQDLRRLLAADGFLAPLLRERSINGTEVEAQFRGGDEVHLYCGLACIVKCGRDGDSSIWVESHHTYVFQSSANRLFRPASCRVIKRDKYVRDVWSVGDPAFAPALEAFLNEVTVGESQTKEGSIQARWSKVIAPWIVFDKEAQLAYPSEPARASLLSEAFCPSVEAARNELRLLAQSRRPLPNRRAHWGMPPKQKNRLKIDQLAVDSVGNLVLLEVKDTSRSASEVYYAPFQLLQNVWEWQRALPAVRSSVQELLDARVELGLTPGGTRRITGGIRAAVGFGTDERSEEVRSRYSEVLRIVNARLPAAVSSIETWALVNGEPIFLE